jgi:phosphatidylglycerophosphatase A
MIEPSSRRWNNHWVHFLAFGLGSGAAPKAPGTFGTLAAIPLYLLLAQLPLWAYLVIIVASFALGIYLCGQASKDMGVHDHGGIVWDEFVGFWITMIAVPMQWPWIIAGFVLFRFFDIIKPWPIGWLDKRVHGGLGIMIDDVIAGVFALIILQVALFFL